MSKFIQKTLSWLHVVAYRLSGGRIGGRFMNLPVLLMTCLGSKSGKRRTTPLLYVRDGERFILVASNGGRPKHPAWFINLRARPRAIVHVGSQRINCYAEIAAEPERDELFQRAAALNPQYAEYASRTDRVIPIVILRPAGEAGADPLTA